MRRATLLSLAAVILVQSMVVARVFTPRPHSGGDNAGYVALAHSLLERGAYQELWDPAEPPHTKYPPVLPVILAGFILLGAKGWAALKLVPALSTVLAVAFTFLWARGRRGLAFGVAMGLLVGLSESVVYYSQWVLSDPVFLALTMAALWALERNEVGTAGGGKPDGHRGWFLWTLLGSLLVSLAYLTRSAGLPLAVAAALWLLWERKWKGLGLFALVAGIPAFLWWVRGMMVGGASDYVSEFWLVDPYQPALGTVGFSGLVERASVNLVQYMTVIIPGGIVGDGSPLLPLLGLALGLLALVGWLRSMRVQIRVAEFFFPLYFALILLWPEAWSGDRFSLPLLPLLFFYSGEALTWTTASLSAPVRRGIVGTLGLGLGAMAALSWAGMVGPAADCREATREGRHQECLFPAKAEYMALARWSGSNLPEEAVVTTRKPRIFFLSSGVPARSIPLVRGGMEFLGEMASGASRYVSLDRLDGISGYYVYPVVSEQIALFCGMVVVGDSSTGGTRLLGILDQGDGREGTGEEGGADQAVGLAPCPETMYSPSPRAAMELGPWEIPLLQGVAGEEGT